MAKLKVQNIRKSYANLEVIHGLNLEIEDGSFVVLLGPSGCGKSTLLRMIAGLESITSGEVIIGDEVVNKIHPKDRNIAMVFQNYALYANMTVFDNIAFSLKLRKMSAQKIREKVDWAASILNLQDFLKRYPRQLSGGQRQRVAMGRAIVRDPAAFLFDEPLSNLDAKLRVQMRTEIRELHSRLNTTTVYVTHDQIEAMTMADKIVVLKDGVIEQYGSPLEVYDKPQNRFVAEFIGSPAMNFIEGEIKKSASSSAVVFKSGGKQILPKSIKLDDGVKVAVGIRPEHVEFSKAGLSFEIRQIEPTGPELHIYGVLEDKEFCIVTKERVDFRRGDKIKVKPTAGNLHIFDNSSGLRIN